MKNERYDELNQKISQWYKDGSQDKLILQTLYAQCNLEHNAMLDGACEGLKKGTFYSGVTDEEMVAEFSREKFNNLSQEDLTHLMQEVHNRYIAEQGCDVTRLVKVAPGGEEDEGTFGYCCYADDLLFINKDMIDDAKRIHNNSEAINAETVGKYFLDTVWHETKHVIQYEDGINFALGRQQDPETAFSAAAMMIMMTNFSICDEHGDDAYAEKWQQMYRFHFCEHEANYAALKKAEQFSSDELKDTYDYQLYASDSAALALGFTPSVKDQSKNLSQIGNRVNRIESYLKTQINYFKNGVKNCPLKQAVLETVDSYMKEDANGHSPFRDRMRSEITEMVDTYVENKKKMNVADYQNNDSKGKGKVKTKTRKDQNIAEDGLYNI